jgi:ABC-2 type transport system permease protein
VLSVLVLQGIFDTTPALGGWSFEGVLALIGVALILESLMEAWLVPCVGQLSERIRLGTLDALLIAPIDSQFYLSFSRFRIWDLGGAILGYVVVTYAALSGGEKNWMTLVQFNFFMCSSVIIFYCFFLSVNLLAFWLVKLDEVWIVAYTLIEMGKYPISAYPKALHILLMYVFPIGLISSMPASVFERVLDWTTALQAWAYCVGSLLATRVLWISCIPRYSGASS